MDADKNIKIAGKYCPQIKIYDFYDFPEGAPTPEEGANLLPNLPKTA